MKYSIVILTIIYLSSSSLLGMEKLDFTPKVDYYIAVKKATKCPCGQDFNNVELLKTHIKATHLENKKYTRPIAAKKFHIYLTF